jgi:hypothetical protein
VCTGGSCYIHVHMYSGGGRSGPHVFPGRSVGSVTDTPPRPAAGYTYTVCTVSTYQITVMVLLLMYIYISNHDGSSSLR